MQIGTSVLFFASGHVIHEYTQLTKRKIPIVQTGWCFTLRATITVCISFEDSFINIFIRQHVNWFGLLSDTVLSFALPFACLGNSRRWHMHLQHS